MKTIIAIIIMAFGFALTPSAQITTIAGQTHWRDTVKWGGSVDSASYIRARGTAIARDSSGTWVTITTDSCSKWVRKERGSQNPIWRNDLQYLVRTSSGNTDSSRVLINIDSRYCLDPVRSRGCDSIVHAGRHNSYPDVTIQDTIITQSTTAGVTWRATSQGFSIAHGNQVRLCIDNYEAGGATGDTTFFKNFILGFQ